MQSLIEEAGKGYTSKILKKKKPKWFFYFQTKSISANELGWGTAWTTVTNETPNTPVLSYDNPEARGLPVVGK